MIDEKKRITGNDFVDKLTLGPYVKNPAYNPKTKEGRNQPQTIIDTSPGDINDGSWTRTVQNMSRISFTGQELGFTNEAIKRDNKLGIALSPYNTDEALNKARARAQSWGSKLVNTLVQAGYGEMVLGILEGFGNIHDGLVGLITGDMEQSGYTRFWYNQKEKLRENFAIYRENPGKAFDFTDWGWWFEGLVNSATTVSLMVPALGWAKLPTAISKITRLSKLTSGATKAISRGMAKATVNRGVRHGVRAGDAAALRQLGIRADKINKTMNTTGDIAKTSFLSRTGEGYMEGKAVYEDVYADAKENLENMIKSDIRNETREYQKFLENNPQFEGISVDEIAKEIATDASKKTFHNDYYMLLMDAFQFKVLGSVWGRMRRTPTARERIAVKNQKRKLAGLSDEQLIKDNILTRNRERIAYTFKGGWDGLQSSVILSNISEGIEEGFQGIQTEKGMEVAAKYFDPSLTTRTFGSYLTDASIWDQAWWGVIGGVLFQSAGGGIRNGSKKLHALWNKKTMTAEDYERWKRSANFLAKEQLDGMSNQIEQFVSDMNAVSSGVNPLGHRVDPSNQVAIIKDGKVINEEIDAEQQELLANKLIRQLIDNNTFDAIDFGSYDLLKDILTSKEFENFLTSRGIRLGPENTAITQYVLNRMEAVHAAYNSALNDLAQVAKKPNPTVVINAARSIARNKLAIEDLNIQLDSIEADIAESASGQNIKKYEWDSLHRAVEESIKTLNDLEAHYKQEFDEGRISKSAYELHKSELERSKRALVKLDAERNGYVLKNEVSDILKQAGSDANQAIKQINDIINKTIFADPGVEPTDTVKSLIEKRNTVLKRLAYAESRTPITNQDYIDMYDEFSYSMDAIAINKAKDSIKKVKEYLMNAENFSEAYQKVMNENTGIEEVDNALHFIKYGYFSGRHREHGLDNPRITGQRTYDSDFTIAVLEARVEREKADKRKKEAEEQGVELPTDDSSNAATPSTGTDTNAAQNQTADNSAAPQPTPTPAPQPTPQQTQPTNTSPATSPTPTSTPAPATNSNIPNTPTSVPQNPADDTSQPEPDTSGLPTEPEESPIIDTQGLIDENPSDADMTEQQLKEQAAIAETSETDDIKASIDANKYVMQVGFKESGRLDAISDALSRNDDSKYLEFIKEIVDFLVNRGYNRTLAEQVAKKSFNAVVASFAAMDSKSSFGKLAHQLAIGFSEEGAKKHSITELIDGVGIDEIVEAFLEEYGKLVESNTVDGIRIINMASLFNYILNNENIDIRTAVYIYNNIGRFIATHDGSKYRFTGFDITSDMSAREFFNSINENKSQTLASMDDMHISPIPPEDRTKDYNDALIAAANGAKTFAKSEISDDGESHLGIYVTFKKNKQTITVKVGILRKVSANADLTQIQPAAHRSGFSNAMTIGNNGEISLDCDFLFNALINEHKNSATAKELFEDLARYYMAVQEVSNKLRLGLLNAKTANKELAKAMPEEMAKRILENPLIRRLLESGVYRIHNGETMNEIDKAKKLAESISSILFYGHGFINFDPTNFSVNTMDLDASTMRERYEEWKKKVYSNYVHTYELQKGLTSENAEVDVSVNVAYYTRLNTIENREQYPNIADNNFDIDKNSPNHTPLVMVTPDFHLVDEYGNDYGLAHSAIGRFSTGFLVHNKDGVKYVAYFNQAQELPSGTPGNKTLKDYVYQEIFNLIYKQFANIAFSSHGANFQSIVNKLTDLFNPTGLFIFNDFRTRLLVTQDKSTATIAVTDANGNRTNLITFFSKNKNNTNASSIGLYIPRLGKQIAINSIDRAVRVNGELVTSDEIKSALADAINASIESMKLNKSLNAFKGAPSTVYERRNGKFVVKLAGQEIEYENYGDFMLSNRAFNTNVYSDKNGNFVTGHMSEGRITINTRVRSTKEDVTPQNTFVSDLMFNEKNIKRKTVDTKEILDAAGVPQEKIDVLFGTKSGLPIVHKKVYASALDDGETNAFYDEKTNRIYITPKGAASMNGDPVNTVRLLLHENLHRLFHRKGIYNDADRERIVRELREVYDYTIAQLERDRQSGAISEKLYNDIKSVFDKATSYDNEQTNMEEFLMECLTQPIIVNYLNNTEYKEEANIDGIPQRGKTIFQKIMDILLDLLGINANRIKNNSILAKEYLILSKIRGNTSNTSARVDNTNNPVEGASTQPSNQQNAQRTNNNAAQPTSRREALNKVKAEIDEIRQKFETRIQRSPNFKEDHVYLIDGKPADLSVTQRTSGSKEIGLYKVPSTALGNTADAAARVFFDNGGHLPDDYPIPNVVDGDGENSRQRLENDLMKIKKYLDDRFGANQYGVITEEFPIGGVINVNGEEKTIAGTMDMLVYTANGDIYIFDFKTKRLGNTGGEINENTLTAYKNQVNIYRQLIVANNPHLAERVKTGGLFKMLTDYPAPSQKDGIEYRMHPTIPNQLQIKENGEFVNIQDSLTDYSSPFFIGNEDFEKSHVINVEQEDFVDEIKSLPELEKPSDSNADIAGSELLQNDNPDEDFNFDDYELDDSLDFHDGNDSDGSFRASTELIEVDEYTSEQQQILINAPRNNNGQRLAPNGNVSNLTEQQYVQVRTRAFKSWFGDWENNPNEASKVVDENGEPLIVYHTTMARKLENNSFRDYVEEDFSKDDEWFTGKDLNNIKAEGFIVTEKDEIAYNNGETIRVRKPNAIFVTDSREMSNSYSIEERDAAVNYDMWLEDNIDHLLEVRGIIEEEIYKEVLYELHPDGWSDLTREEEEEIKAIVKQRMAERDDTADLSNPYDINSTNILGSEFVLYANIKNPLIVDAKGSLWNNIDFNGTIVNIRDIELYARNNGYDGAIIKDVVDYGGGAQTWIGAITSGNDVIIIFNPNNVKSVNNETFDKNNNDIYRSATNLISAAEIYATPIVNGSTDNAYGVQLATNMASYVNQFPSQYRDNIQHLVAENELNYSCQ